MDDKNIHQKDDEEIHQTDDEEISQTDDKEIPKLSDEEILQHIEKFYADLGDRPAYTMEAIQYAHEQFSKLSFENPICSLMDIDGKIRGNLDFHLLLIPPETSGGELRLVFLDYKHWAIPKLQELGFQESARDQILPFAERRFPFCASQIGVPLPPALNESELAKAQDLWKESTYRRELLQAVHKVRGTVANDIKKIVCVGLGPLYTVYKPEERVVWNCDYHMVAFDIAEVLKVKRKKRIPFTITFQDPSYMIEDRDWLKQVGRAGGFAVKFAESPMGLGEIDKDTLVLAHSYPLLPIRQIVADLTSKFNGPAGIFCTTVDLAAKDAPITAQDELAAWRQPPYTDPESRRVVSMLKNFTPVHTIDEWRSTLYLKKQP